MPWFEFIPLNIVIGIILFWIALGAAGLIAQSNLHYVTRILLPAGAAAGVALAATAFAAMSQEAALCVVPLGLPDLPFHLRIDALSAFSWCCWGSRPPAFRCFTRATCAPAKTTRRA